jgi:hypothetical protein
MLKEKRERKGAGHRMKGSVAVATRQGQTMNPTTQLPPSSYSLSPAKCSSPPQAKTGHTAAPRPTQLSCLTASCSSGKAPSFPVGHHLTPPPCQSMELSRTNGGSRTSLETITDQHVLRLKPPERGAFFPPPPA